MNLSTVAYGLFIVITIEGKIYFWQEIIELYQRIFFDSTDYAIRIIRLLFENQQIN